MSRKIQFAPIVAKAEAIKVLQQVISSGERLTGPQLRARIRESHDAGAMIADNKWVLSRLVSEVGRDLKTIATTPVFPCRNESRHRPSPANDVRLDRLERLLVRICESLSIPTE